jgi:hypothetical protein
MAEITRLKELNRQTFDAETKKKIGGQDWDTFLWSVLANNFQIRRANPDILPQNKAEMISYIHQFGNTLEREVEDEDVFQSVPYGVVSSTVTFQGVGQFHNLKVFVRSPQPSAVGWQCVYWHVSKLPATA